MVCFELNSLVMFYLLSQKLEMKNQENTVCVWLKGRLWEVVFHFLLHHFVQFFFFFEFSPENHQSMSIWMKEKLAYVQITYSITTPAWTCMKTNQEMTCTPGGSITPFSPSENQMKTFPQSFRKFHLLRSTEKGGKKKKKRHSMLFNSENIPSVYSQFERKYACS